MNPPPGWHPDYRDSSIERWWDGQRWTARIRPRRSVGGTQQLSEAKAAGRRDGSGKGRRRWPWIAGGVIVGLIAIASLTDPDTTDQPTVPIVTTITDSSPAMTMAPASTTAATGPRTSDEDVPVVPLVPEDNDRTRVYVPTTPAYVPPPSYEYIPPPEAPTYVPPPIVESPAEAPTSIYYKNCAAVRDAGADPIYVGQPGYSSHLDRDADGVACEK